VFAVATLGDEEHQVDVSGLVAPQGLADKVGRADKAATSTGPIDGKSRVNVPLLLWKAGCGQSRPSGLDRGKGRKALPIGTAEGWLYEPCTRASGRKSSVQNASHVSPVLCLMPGPIYLETPIAVGAAALLAFQNHVL
jgi:hypothetical protein